MGIQCRDSSTTTGVAHNSRLTKSYWVSLFYSEATNLNQGYFTIVWGNSKFEILIRVRSCQPWGWLAAAFSGVATVVSCSGCSGAPIIAETGVVRESCSSLLKLFSERRQKCQSWDLQLDWRLGWISYGSWHSQPQCYSTSSSQSRLAKWLAKHSCSYSSSSLPEHFGPYLRRVEAC